MPRISLLKSIFNSSSKKQLELDNVKQISLHNLTGYITNTNCSQIFSNNSALHDVANLKSILNGIEDSTNGRKVLKQVAKSIKKHDKNNVPDIKIKDGASDYITKYLCANAQTIQHTTLNQLLGVHKSLCKAITINPQLSLYLKSLTADKNNQQINSNELLETISRQVNKYDQKEISSKKNKALFSGAVIGGLSGAAIGSITGLAVGATIDLGLLGFGMGIPTVSSAILGTLGGGVLGSLTGGFIARKYAGANVYANLIKQYKQPFIFPNNNEQYSFQNPYGQMVNPYQGNYLANNMLQQRYNGMDMRQEAQPLYPQQTSLNYPQRPRSPISHVINTDTPRQQSPSIQSPRPIPIRQFNYNPLQTQINNSHAASDNTLRPNRPYSAPVETTTKPVQEYRPNSPLQEQNMLISSGINLEEVLNNLQQQNNSKLSRKNNSQAQAQLPNYGSVPIAPEFLDRDESGKRLGSPFEEDVAEKGHSGTYPFDYEPDEKPYRYA